MTMQQELQSQLDRVRGKEMLSLERVAQRSHEYSMSHRARTPERRIWVDLSWAAFNMARERRELVDPHYA